MAERALLAFIPRNGIKSDNFKERIQNKLDPCMSEGSSRRGSLDALVDSTTAIELSLANSKDPGYANDFMHAAGFLLDMSAANQERLKKGLEECTLSMGDMRTRKIIYSAIESFIQTHPSPTIRLVICNRY